MRIVLSINILLVMLAACASPGQKATPAYEATEVSLAQHEAAPEWFRDAKLGIYFHWGPYTVPEYAKEWYPRWIHFKDLKVNGKNVDGTDVDFNAYHTETYGPLEKFGYHDLIPLFTAEKFNAEEWADLFAASGAQFAGPVGMHHDGFAMWDSEVTPWNAGDIGPKRDIAGEIAEAVRSRGMKFMMSFHHERNLQRYRGVSLEEAIARKEGDGDPMWAYYYSYYPWIEGTPPTSDDPKLARLYGNIPENEWLETIWLPVLTETIDKYEPDLIWFDAKLNLIPEEYRYRFAQYYLNAAQGWDREVVMTHKDQDMPTSFSVLDFEKGRSIDISKLPFLTDDSVTKRSWSYTRATEIKPLEAVLDEFIDIVSKNGQLLLNIAPRADGSIPQDQRDLLLGLGAWLKVNGEAIFGTRPWVTAGEGDTTISETGSGADLVEYTDKDIRFTTKGDALYALTLGMPRGTIVIKSLAEGSLQRTKPISNVAALNGDWVESWSRDAQGLTITLKPGAPAQPAYAFRIEG